MHSLTPASLLPCTLAVGSGIGHSGAFLGTYTVGALHDWLPGPSCDAPQRLLGGREGEPPPCPSEYANGTLVISGIILLGAALSRMPAKGQLQPLAAAGICVGRMVMMPLCGLGVARLLATMQR